MAAADPRRSKARSRPLNIDDPNILGIERISTRSIETIEEALVCLASSQPVYGITVENSNVRPNAKADDLPRRAGAAGSIWCRWMPCTKATAMNRWFRMDGRRQPES